MVIRVAAVVLCVLLGIPNLTSSLAEAGGPPVPAPAYQCAPQGYAVPDCGPRPFAFCGGILRACSGICGTVLGCPSAIAGIILDTPPPFFPRRRWCPPVCGPVMCAPRMCAPPVCMPAPCPPPPRRITKTKPVASMAPPVAPVCYAPPVYSLAPMPCRPRMASCGPRHPVIGPGCVALCATLLEMPLRLCSGVLSVQDGPLGPLASTFETSLATFSHYW
jgi:hypothetical protein